MCALMLAGCGQNNPVAPKTTGAEYKALLFKPVDIAYEAVLGGDPGYKPWYWFDADNNPAFNAQIRTLANGQTARISRVTGGTWGKVHTEGISCGNDYNNIRIFVPGHSASVAWKLVIQEENGQWRNWVLQDSTGLTGYQDYDFATILSQVNSGSGAFTIEVVVEGEVGTYIDVAELYVYDADAAVNTGTVYWCEQFAQGTPEAVGAHTAGWFDATTNPDYHCTITNLPGANGLIQDPSTMGGKVLSPVIPWNEAHCNEIRIAANTNGHYLSVWLQEQEYQYRRYQLNVIATPEYYYCDISQYNLANPLGQPTSFSISIEDVYSPITVDYIEVR